MRWLMPAPILVFMSGKLRLAGDMMFATTLQTWFNT